MARELTQKEYIVRQLEKGRTIWRSTKSGMISYTKVNNDGILRITTNLHTDKKVSKTISWATAINQLVRNFKQIN